MEGFSAREIQNTRAARKLYNIARTPSARAPKYLIQSNTVKNNPVTLKNVKVADEIFGLKPSVVKGRNKRKTPERVVFDYLEIPNEIVARNRRRILFVGFGLSTLCGGMLV